jgi:hypothetical protein
VRDIFLSGPRTDDYSIEAKPADKEAASDMLAGYEFSPDKVRSVLTKIEAARKTESDRRKQRSLDSWM